MFQRMIKAAMFDTATYEEIEADRGALDQAIVVVILVTFCGIIGGMLSALLAGFGVWAVVFGLLAGLTFGVARWALWVTALYVVGRFNPAYHRHANELDGVGQGGWVRLYARVTVNFFVRAVRGKFLFLGRFFLDNCHRRSSRPPIPRL